MSGRPSYHDLYVTTTDIPRTSIAHLPYDLTITCTHGSGWELWRQNLLPLFGASIERVRLASEFGNVGLRLDVAGVVIVDSLT